MKRNLTKSISNITVKKFEWGIDTDQIEQYIVADSLAISDQQIKDHHMTKVDEIKYPNGDVALKIIKTDPKPQ